MNISVNRQLERRLLLLVLLVGAWLRFYQLADTEFNVDQMYPVWQALMTLQKGEFPIIGQGTSVLFANPALTGYLYAPFLIVGANPLTPLVVVIILNGFGIWFTYRAIRILLGVPIALIATSLFAVNPWIIEYSRQTWVQSLMIFFITFIFMAFVPILLQRSALPSRRLWRVVIACTLFANTYLLAYWIVIPLGVLTIVFWKRVPKKTLVLGLGLFLGAFSLYAYGLGREWEITRSRAESFLAEGESHLSDEALGHAIRLVTGWEYAAARGVNAPADDAVWRSRISDGVHWLWVGALLIGIGQAILAIQRKNIFHDTAVILLLWYSLPILSMTYVSRIVHPFYVLFSVPAGHALAAWGIMPLFRSKLGLRLGLMMILLTAWINGLNSVRFYQESHANSGEHSPGTFTVGISTNIGRRIADAYEDGMVVYTPMDVWGPMSFAGKIFPTIRAFEFDRHMVIPPQGGLYMTFHLPNEPIAPPIHGQAIGIPLYMHDGTRFVLWRAEQKFTPRHTADIPSDIGVSFIGWHLLQPLQPNKTVQLRTYWRVDSLPIERYGWIFVPYAHLFDANGNRIAIIDGDALPMTTWQVGDWFVQEMRITIPADSVGPYKLNVGIFDGGRLVNAIFHYSENGEMIFSADITLVE